MAETMRAAVFKDVRDIHIEEVPVPRCGRPRDRQVTTTSCGTDSTSGGEYAVAPGGSRRARARRSTRSATPSGMSRATASSSALSPCGACYFASQDFSQCAGYEDQWGRIGGWRLGNSADGVRRSTSACPTRRRTSHAFRRGSPTRASSSSRTRHHRHRRRRDRRRAAGRPLSSSRRGPSASRAPPGCRPRLAVVANERRPSS